MAEGSCPEGQTQVGRMVTHRKLALFHQTCWQNEEEFVMILPVRVLQKLIWRLVCVAQCDFFFRLSSDWQLYCGFSSKIFKSLSSEYNNNSCLLKCFKTLIEKDADDLEHSAFLINCSCNPTGDIQNPEDTLSYMCYLKMQIYEFDLLTSQKKMKFSNDAIILLNIYKEQLVLRCI